MPALRAFPVPKSVCVVSERLVGDIDAGRLPETARPVLARLLLDIRMEPVWKEILRRKGMGKFIHQARLDGLDVYSHFLQALHHKIEKSKSLRPMDLLVRQNLSRKLDKLKREQIVSKDRLRLTSSSQRQDLACLVVFLSAFVSFLSETPLFTKGDLKLAASFMRKQATELEGTGRIISSLCEDLPDLRSTVERLQREARFIERAPTGLLLVGRHRTDAKLRSFVIQMDRCLRGLFAESLLGTAAAIANVVFDREDVTGSRIRALVRSVRT